MLLDKAMQGAPAAAPSPGLLQEPAAAGMPAAPPPAGMPGPAAMPPEQAPQEGAPATPEQEEQLDNIMTNMLEFIHGPNVDMLIEQIGSSDEPARAIGTIAAQIGMGQIQSAEAAGVTIEDAVILEAGNRLVGELVEVADAAKLIDATDEFKERAFYFAMEKYGEALQGGGQEAPPEPGMPPAPAAPAAQEMAP